MPILQSGTSAHPILQTVQKVPRLLAHYSQISIEKDKLYDPRCDRGTQAQCGDREWIKSSGNVTLFFQTSFYDVDKFSVTLLFLEIHPNCAQYRSVQ